MEYITKEYWLDKGEKKKKPQTINALKDNMKSEKAKNKLHKTTKISPDVNKLHL